MLIWMISFFALTAINPLNPYDWLMENILTLTFFIILAATYKKFRFSDFSYFLITIFFTLHMIGAHYTYSEVPLGFYLKDAFNLSRNHFDRLVHFSFGLLITYPLHEILVRKIALKKFWKFYLPLNLTFAAGSFFELIEWLFVQLVNPDLGAAYLGLQGDIWDAQKDMLLVLCGSLMALFFISGKQPR